MSSRLPAGADRFEDFLTVLRDATEPLSVFQVARATGTSRNIANHVMRSLFDLQLVRIEGQRKCPPKRIWDERLQRHRMVDYNLQASVYGITEGGRGWLRSLLRTAQITHAKASQVAP